jgi:hypothetical protein
MADHSKTRLFVRFSNGFKKMAAFYHSKTGHKKCVKNDHSKPDGLVFGCSLYFIGVVILVLPGLLVRVTVKVDDLNNTDLLFHII